MSAAFQRGARGATVALGLLCIFACKRAPPPEPPAPPAAAVVNGAPIPISQVQHALDRMRRGEASEAKVAAQDVPRLAPALLDVLIDRSVVLQPASPIARA